MNVMSVFVVRASVESECKMSETMALGPNNSRTQMLSEQLLQDSRHVISLSNRLEASQSFKTRFMKRDCDASIL